MRVYTGGKDGTLRGYRINVQYRKNEDPKLETTFKIGNSVTSIEISPDGKTLANTGTDKRELERTILTLHTQMAERCSFGI